MVYLYLGSRVLGGGVPERLGGVTIPLGRIKDSIDDSQMRRERGGSVHTSDAPFHRIGSYPRGLR